MLKINKRNCEERSNLSFNDELAKIYKNRLSNYNNIKRYSEKQEIATKKNIE